MSKFIFTLAAIILIWALIAHLEHERKACEARGGWYMSSDNACLSREMLK